MTDQRRGNLTPRIKEKSKELLGYTIDSTELRLMPYIQYQMTNEHRIDRLLISSYDAVILKKWEALKYVWGPYTDLKISKKFWDIINEIIYLGYVDTGIH